MQGRGEGPNNLSSFRQIQMASDVPAAGWTGRRRRHRHLEGACRHDVVVIGSEQGCRLGVGQGSAAATSGMLTSAASGTCENERVKSVTKAAISHFCGCVVCIDKHLLT